MTTSLLLADTHLPKRAKDIPAEVWQATAEADVVVHAGDWVDVALLDELEARSSRLDGPPRRVQACLLGTERARPDAGQHLTDDYQRQR